MLKLVRQVFSDIPAGPVPSSMPLTEPSQIGERRLVVRWQMGNTLYHAGVDMDASGQTPATFYAGKTQSTDSCSVSACDPHTLD